MAKKEWSITTERYVAYFDIMGFKAMIAKDKGTTGLYYGFKKLVDGIERRLKKYTYIKVSVFSDLIVIITKDNSIKSFTQLSSASMILIQDALKKEKWGMNGCIAKGTVSFDESRKIFLGQPIVDAYLTTEDIEYYGVVVHHTAEEDMKTYCQQKKDEGTDSHMEKLFVEQRLHFKSGYYTQYHMRWFDFNDVMMYDPEISCQKYVKILKDISEKTNGRGRRYIEYTIDTIKEKIMENQWG